MLHVALIVVDVQNDFCPGGSLAVPSGDKVIAPLNKMIAFAKKKGWLVIASRCWHPETTNHFKKDGGIWPVHCVQGSHGAEFHPKLRVKDDATIVSKGTKPREEGYSAFDGFVENDGCPLRPFLRNRGIDTIYIGGLATDYCVKATALGGVQNFFETIVIVDACRAVNLKDGDDTRAFAEMREKSVSLLNIAEVLARNA